MEQNKAIRLFILFNLLILILTFSFQSLTKADDISDFQIEGMSIGDSALDYFTINELNDSLDKYDYLDKYRYYFFSYSKGKEYEYLQITVKQKDSKYIIYDLQGHIFYSNNIKKCNKKLNEIKKDIDGILNTEGKEYSGAHWIDKTGESKYKRINYSLQGGIVDLICFDMSKKLEEKGKEDRLSITFTSREFAEWLDKNYSKMKTN